MLQQVEGGLQYTLQNLESVKSNSMAADLGPQLHLNKVG